MVNFDSSDSSLQGLGVLVGSVVYANTGCTDPGAYNYNSLATSDDGTCCNSGGCINPLASNYDSFACYQFGVCIFNVYGCMDPTQINYNSYATHDDGSCAGAIQYGCVNSTTITHNNIVYYYYLWLYLASNKQTEIKMEDKKTYYTEDLVKEAIEELEDRLKDEEVTSGAYDTEDLIP